MPAAHADVTVPEAAVMMQAREEIVPSLQRAVAALKTLRGVTSAWVKEQQVKLEDGKITQYQVNLQITLVLEG